MDSLPDEIRFRSIGFILSGTEVIFFAESYPLGVMLLTPEVDQISIIRGVDLQDHKMTDDENKAWKMQDPENDGPSGRT